MWNILAPGIWRHLLNEWMDHPVKLGLWGTGSGSATMAFAKLSSETRWWENFDKIVYRIGATATAISAVLAVILMGYRLYKAHLERLEPNKSN